MSASEAQFNAWEQRLLSHGFGTLTPWQRDIMRQWLQDASWIAFFPVGGGIGFSYLVPALDAPTGVTWVVCGDAQRCSRREYQARALGSRATILQANQELPALHTGVVLMSAEEAEKRGEMLSTWVTGRVRRVIVDGCEASPHRPSWWQAAETLPFGIYPLESNPDAWWFHTLNAPHQTLHYDHEEMRVAWDLGEGSLLQKIGRAVEEGANLLWVFGGRLFRKALQETTGLRVFDPPQAAEKTTEKSVDTPETNETLPLSQASDNANERALSPQVSEISSHATLYLFPANTSFLQHVPPPQHVFVGRLPNTLRDLGTLANAQPERISLILQRTPPTETSSEHNVCLRFLEEKAQPHAHEPLYLNSHEIMQALKLPLSPQIAYERSLKTLEELLDSLQKEGNLIAWYPVYFQAKLLNVRGFQPAQLAAHPDLLAFYDAITQMQKQLSPLESLGASFLNGRALDLRFLSKRIPYTVRELNTIFQKLHEHNLVINRLEHLPGPQHTLEHEYQIEMGEITQPNLAIQLWSRTEEARLPFLRSSLSRQPFPEDAALQALWGLDPQSNDFWEKALALLDKAQKEERLHALGGRILQRLEREPKDAGLALWMGIIATLQLPPLNDPNLYRRLLPPPRQAPAALFPLCKHLLLQQADPPRSWVDYVLALPTAEEDEEISRLFVQHNAQRILDISRFHGRFRWLLYRYHHSMSQLTRPLLPQESHLSDKTEDAPIASGAEDSTHAPSENASSGSTSPENTSSEAVKMEGVSSKSTNAESALTDNGHRSSHPPLLPPHLRTTDVQQLATHFSLETLGAWGWSLHLLGESEAGLPLLRATQQENERCKQRYAKLVLQSPKQLFREKSEWLRWLIDESEDRNDEKLRKRVIKLLVDRKEGTTEDLQQAAQWAEQEGDPKRAARFHKQLLELRPDAPEHPAALARISLQHNKLQEALQYAIQANRLNPRHYPLDVFLDKAQESLFADLEQLRHILVDLPAHPALSKIESELSQREHLTRELAPTLKQAEEDLQQQRLAQARDKAREILEKHANLAPIRFLQIRREVDLAESKLQQAIQDLDRRGRGPKDPRDRNKQLEALSDQAAQFGFAQLATEGYERLTQRNDAYGLAWVKLARITPHPQQRNEAYAKALSLARGPEQRLRNLEEWAQILDREGKLDILLPTLLSILEQHSEEAQQLEPILLKLIGKYGVRSDVAQKLEGFLKHHRSGLDLKRAEQALNEIEHLDPWKRQLLTMQAEIAQKNTTRPAKSAPKR